MKWFLSSFLAGLWLLPGLYAVEKPYQEGKIVDIQQKSETRVLYYLVNTPITQDDPYYEVSVELNHVVYVGQYTPRHSADSLPEDLKIDSPVDVKLEKRRMYLRRPSGSDVDLVIVKRIVPKSVPEKPDPAPARN